MGLAQGLLDSLITPAPSISFIIDVIPDLSEKGIRRGVCCTGALPPVSMVWHTSVTCPS